MNKKLSDKEFDELLDDQGIRTVDVNCGIGFLIIMIFSIIAVSIAIYALYEIGELILNFIDKI